MMWRNILQRVGVVGAIFFFIMPLVVWGQVDTNQPVKTTQPVVKAEQSGIIYVCYDENKNPAPCDKFSDLIGAINFFVNRAIQLALLFSVVPNTYAGWLYLNTGSSPGNKDKAKKMLTNVALGIVIMLAAWLIVSLITNALVKPDVTSGFENK